MEEEGERTKTRKCADTRNELASLERCVSNANVTTSLLRLPADKWRQAVCVKSAHCSRRRFRRNRQPTTQVAVRKEQFAKLSCKFEKLEPRTKATCWKTNQGFKSEEQSLIEN